MKIQIMKKKNKENIKKTYQKIKFYKKFHNIVIHIYNLETHMRNFKHLIKRIISHDNSIK